MTAREYLNQTFVINSEINRKLQHIAALRNLLESDTTKLTGMPRNPSPNNSRMADIIAEIADLEKEADMETDRLVNIKRTILSAAYALDKDIARQVIELRYIKAMSWPMVMKETGYSKRQLFRYHKEALEKINLPK